MNAKKVNWLFLIILILEVGISFGFMFLAQRYYTLGIVESLLLTELILLVPAGIFLLASKGDKKEILCFRKIKPKTIGMIVLFVYLCMPLTTFVNALTLFFTNNVVVEAGAEFLQLPFIVVLLLIGVYGPICEELTFRAVFYQGYKKSGTVFYAIFFSALTFGFVHMNLNQMPYAFVIGIMLALLREATGSMWGPILFHVIFNSHSVVMMYISKAIYGDTEIEAALSVTRNNLIGVSMLGVLAVGATALACCVLVYIARNEERLESIKGIWKNRKEGKGRLVSIPLLLALAGYLVMMILFL